MEIKIHVQFESTRGATQEEKDEIENKIRRIINSYEDLVFGYITIKLLDESKDY